MRGSSTARWIEDDAYDRARLAEVRRWSSALRDVEASGTVLLPRFGALVEDLFAGLFKLVVVRRTPDEVVASARVHGPLLDGLLAEDVGGHLRERTRLDEARAGLATVLLAERAIELLRSRRALSKADFVEQLEIARSEDEAERLERQAEEADRARDEAAESDDARDRLDAVARSLRRDAEAERRRGERRASSAAEALADRTAEVTRRAELAALDVARSFDEAADDAASFGEALGAGRSVGGAQALELGRRLARSEKLRRLARLVGAMREHALALRHRRFERASQEVHEVERGRDLGRLLPHELATRRHAILGKDWRRRFVEGELQQVALRGDDERGRGPMVVLVDVSSSMAGDKEVWAKAVALTLLEVARRERRRYRAILFSSGPAGLATFDLARGGGDWEADPVGALDLAEHFAGGGTDFEAPLDAAVECLEGSRFRRGDVVLVTDGECRVGDRWLESLRDAKRRLDFSIFAVLIDVGAATVETVARFADRTLRVSELTVENAGSIFGGGSARR